MRIGWGTPFNNKSAIGKFSQFVATELRRRGHEIEIIRLESPEELKGEPLDDSFIVHSAIDTDLSVYDVLVANIGNHSPYHFQLAELLAQRSPIGIFHDIEMRHFERGLHHFHGIALPRLPGSDLDGDSDDRLNLVETEARPLMAVIASMTCGAIVHGDHYREVVTTYCPGPVATLCLSYPDAGLTKKAAPPSSARVVTIFGMIHEHKQPRRVMQALALLKKRVGPIELHLAGSIDDFYEAELRAEAKALGIEEPVCHGYVSDEQLHRLLEESQAICCLRYPVSEGSSASLITALHRGRPLIVPQIASFNQVPDDLVFKVSYGERAEDLADSLERIFRDPRAAQKRATKARQWALDRFSAERYADEFEKLLADIGPADELSRLARQMLPAITDPRGEPTLAAISPVAEAMDWMMQCQS